MNKERYILHLDNFTATFSVIIATAVIPLVTLVGFIAVILNYVSDPTTDAWGVAWNVFRIIGTSATTAAVLYGYIVMLRTYVRADTMYYWLRKMDKENGKAIFDLADAVIKNGKGFRELVDMYINANPRITQEDADNIRRIGNEVADRSTAAVAACKTFNKMADQMTNEVGPPDAI